MTEKVKLLLSTIFYYPIFNFADTLFQNHFQWYQTRTNSLENEYRKSTLKISRGRLARWATPMKLLHHPMIKVDGRIYWKICPNNISDVILGWIVLFKLVWSIWIQGNIERPLKNKNIGYLDPFTVGAQNRSWINTVRLVNYTFKFTVKPKQSMIHTFE